MHYFAKSILLFTIFTMSRAQALPIDVKGRLLFDGHYLSQYRKTGQASTTINDGSPIPTLGNYKNENANFQSYLFQLNPQIIVNDAVSVFSEITSGYAGGGFIGDSTRNRQSNSNPGYGDALYLQNYSGPNNSVYFSQIYAELYADMATFIVGRHSYHWGLGALYNSGSQLGNRFRTIRDGLTVNFKMGNFQFSPFWDKASMHGSLTVGSRTRAWGASALYSNLEKDMTLGLYLAKRSTHIDDEFYTSATTQARLGGTDVKILDIYAKKTWGNYTLGVEVPMISGTLGRVYAQPTAAAPNNTDASYDATAYIVQNDLMANDSWKFHVHGAVVSGNAGSGPAYKAMYLHPNFQMANILFRYNHQAITDRTQSIFDSYLTNALVAKTGSTFNNDTWELDLFLVWAKALQSAKAGQMSYDHFKAKTFQATTDQSKDLGMELDINARYNWNSNVKLFAQFGYLFTGKYFIYNVDSNLQKKNEVALVGGMGVDF